jgi:aminoacyl tRNA synthase complex-interacting multifunctional protein 1
MSYEASLSKLPYPLKDLVTNVQASTGRTDADKLEVVSWIDKVTAGNIGESESFLVSSLA